MKKLVFAAAVACALALPAFADTPIGPGVTGMGGTGPNKSDPDTGIKPERELGMQRPEGSEPISGNAKTEARIEKEDAPRDMTHPSSPAPTGATRGSGARGRVPPDSTGK